MSNRLFQGIIHQMGGALDRNIGVIDASSTVVSASELGRIGETIPEVDFNVLSASDIATVDGYTYKCFGSPLRPEYAVFVLGTDETAKKYSIILSVSMANAKKYYDEKYDKVNFIKNVLLDNILPGDVYLKSRELRLNTDVRRVCMIIKTLSTSDASAYEVVQGLFPDKTKDFVINISETDVALVKELKPNVDEKDIEKLAASIVDTLSGEYYIRSVVGIGTAVTGTRELARSFKEAQVAIEVGKVFETERSIVTYEHLGIARLIYQLPTTLCETFLKEVFKKGSLETMDQETLFTIQKFFENSLNVSETSRKLFVHRNTLVYRLDKIKKVTGLDLREFEDAIVFKVALMVKKYLMANPVKY